MRNTGYSKKLIRILIAVVSVALIFSFLIPAFAEGTAEVVAEDEGILGEVKTFFVDIWNDIDRVLLKTITTNILRVVCW